MAMRVPIKAIAVLLVIIGKARLLKAVILTEPFCGNKHTIYCVKTAKNKNQLMI